MCPRGRLLVRSNSYLRVASGTGRKRGGVRAATTGKKGEERRVRARAAPLPASPCERRFLLYREAIKTKAKAKVETLRRIALQEGMLTLKMDRIVKVFQGITDLGQVMKVCISRGRRGVVSPPPRLYLTLVLVSVADPALTVMAPFTTVSPLRDSNPAL